MARQKSKLQQSKNEKGNVVPITGFDSRPKVITLCGSTRFWDHFQRVNAELTVQGNVVFSVAIPSSGDLSPLPHGTKTVLDQVHFHKIRMSDEILVLNVGGYIGESTQREIEFAKKIGRKVKYLEQDHLGPLFE